VRAWQPILIVFGLASCAGPREVTTACSASHKDAGANTVAVTREMERTLETLRREVPAVRLTVAAEQAGFVVT